MSVMYNSDDIAKVLNVQPSTFRKYSAMLEKNGYQFYKNVSGHRSFSEDDILVFKKLMELKNKPNMTLEKAVIEVIAWREGKAPVEETNSLQPQNEGLNVLLEFKQQQEQFNKQLLEQVKAQQEQIQQQQEYIKNSLERRDHDLMRALKDSLETQKLIASSIEQEKDKKPWWKFWG